MGFDQYHEPPSELPAATRTFARMTSYIPVVGGLIAGLFPFAFALVELPNAYQSVAIFVGIQAIYLIVGSVAVPRMQSRGLNIDPVMGLLSVGVWTLLWGIPGALLANPLTVLVMILMSEFESTRWLATLLSSDGRAPAKG
jgi:AI-2 transport protein TqsA